MTHGIDERKRRLALTVLCLGVLTIVLDTTIVNVALPSIRADLGFTETSLLLGAIAAVTASALAGAFVRMHTHGQEQGEASSAASI
jgi:MFS family permease